MSRVRLGELSNGIVCMALMRRGRDVATYSSGPPSTASARRVNRDSDGDIDGTGCQTVTKV